MYGGSTYITCLSNTKWRGEPIDCTDADVDSDSYGISIAFKTGVDVYFLMDVSKSIDERQFEGMKQCVTALLQNVGVNKTQNSTRVDVYLFAANVKGTFTPRDRLSASDCKMIASLEKKIIFS
ncbi:hypothetical protein DPMN_154817 [Dreissena polymorpha]|uniref:VWFA domain-containing protein n=1 Tax=Dreissena polymorpha TaxID=45954 RepID=A0A9D4J7B6_DREPO|nr:hypothetical protein DPMN_154817 [Dreissena polymorpha]